MNPNTIGNLQGRGHESSDLKRIDRIFRGWHLSVNPKNEYYYFLEKVRKLGKETEVVKYMQKLRKHYKGIELLDEFAQETENLNAEEKPAPLQDLSSKPKDDQNRKVRF
jgi:hypothetical protein